jgi:hypothetical protein
MEDESSGRRGGVDVFRERPETAAALLDGLDDVEKIAQGPRQAVVLGDDNHIPRAHLVEEPIKLGPFP